MAAMLGGVHPPTLLKVPLAHLLLGTLLPSHCGLKELPRVERRAPLLTALAEHLRSCNPAVPKAPNFCHVVCGIVSGHYRHLIPDLQDLESGSPDVPTRRLSTLTCPRRLHSASCPLTFYEKKSSLSGKWRRPGVWPGAPKREIRDLGVI